MDLWSAIWKVSFQTNVARHPWVYWLVIIIKIINWDKNFNFSQVASSLSFPLGFFWGAGVFRKRQGCTDVTFMDWRQLDQYVFF